MIPKHVEPLKSSNGSRPPQIPTAMAIANWLPHPPYSSALSCIVPLFHLPPSHEKMQPAHSPQRLLFPCLHTVKNPSHVYIQHTVENPLPMKGSVACIVSIPQSSCYPLKRLSHLSVVGVLSCAFCRESTPACSTRLPKTGSASAAWASAPRRMLPHLPAQGEGTHSTPKIIIRKTRCTTTTIPNTRGKGCAHQGSTYSLEGLEGHLSIFSKQ